MKESRKMVHYHIRKEQDTYLLEEKNYDPMYFLKTESIFSQCNGYIGVRASLDFRSVKENRGMFVGGIYNKAHESEVTELVNCPDITELQLMIEGRPFYPDRCEIKEYNRVLNTETGQLTITYVCQDETGLELKIVSRRFASSCDRRLFCQEVKIRPLNRGIRSLGITTGINGQITNGGVSHIQTMDARVYDKKYMEITATMKEETLHIMSGVAIAGGSSCQEPEYVLGRRMLHGSYSYRLSDNEELTLLKCSLIDTAAEKEDTEKRKQQLKSWLESGYDHSYQRHCQVRAERYGHTDIQIEGASDEENAAVKFARYHLLGMAPPLSADYSIGAKGLTGEGYKGHVFWDTELFILPFYTYTMPETARNLLKFRFDGLDGARKKAEKFQYEGAMFPWETGKDGHEETPMYAALNIHTGKAGKIWSGLKEHHVTADIVYAIWQYFLITRDEQFMKDYGYEVIFEAARFWTSRAESDEITEQYHIRDIIGPDEYTEHIDDNAYTNYMAAFCVRLAIRLAAELKEKDIAVYQRLDRSSDLGGWEARWKLFSDKIYLPGPDENGIIPQDDTFLSKRKLDNIDKYRTALKKQSVLLDYSRDEVVAMQVLKQADTVMLLNLFPYLFEAEIVRKNVQFYEARTIHDSSLSYCVHAQALAAIGETDMASDFFHKAMDIDLNDNPYDTIDGIHAASLGGDLELPGRRIRRSFDGRRPLNRQSASARALETDMFFAENERLSDYGRNQS